MVVEVRSRSYQVTPAVAISEILINAVGATTIAGPKTYQFHVIKQWIVLFNDVAVKIERNCLTAPTDSLVKEPCNWCMTSDI